MPKKNLTKKKLAIRKEKVTKFKDAFKKPCEKIAQFFKKFGKAFVDFCKKVGKEIARLAIIVKDFVVKIALIVIDFAVKIALIVRDFFVNLYKKVSPKLDPIFKAIGEFFKKVVKSVKYWIDQAKKYKKKDATFIFIILALALIFTAIFVPIVVNNNEVAAAKEAEEEAKKKAFEEAKQAAIEAQKKAEEERLAQLSAALSQEQAAAQAAKAAEEAAEKARQEREELISSINDRVQASVSSAVGQMIDDQTTEDFNTQYSIQDELISTQKKSVDSYQDYVSDLLSSYNDQYEISSEEKTLDQNAKYEDVKKSIEDLKNFYITTTEEEKKNEELAAKQAEQAKYDNHYLRFNRFDFGFRQDSVSLEYVRKTKSFISFGLKGEYFWNTMDVNGHGLLEFTFIDQFKYNFGLELAGGVTYGINNSNLSYSFTGSPVFRFTVQDGCELVYRPRVLVSMKDFSSDPSITIDPFTFGVSFVF